MATRKVDTVDLYKRAQMAEQDGEATITCTVGEIIALLNLWHALLVIPEPTDGVLRFRNEKTLRERVKCN